MRRALIAALASSFLATVPAPVFAQEASGEPVFRVPIGQAAPSSAVDPIYSWVESSSSCSTTCGTGTRTTSFQCQNVADFDVVSGNFGSAEPDSQCTAAVGPRPSGSTTACTVFSGCTFDWVKPPVVVTPTPIDDNPVGRPGCGQIRRQFTPHCERLDGTIMADGDHSFCRNDRPDYNDVAAGVPDALGYDRTTLETASCNASDHEWIVGGWSGWSSTCSTTALRTRTVSCQRKFDAAPAADSACAGPKPSTSEIAAQYGSCTFSAEMGSWSAWSSDCSATANRTRTVQCRRSNGDVVPVSECTSRGIAVGPASETAARYGSCTYSRVNPTAWSSWSSTCSPDASRSRTYDCRRSDGTIVADSECTSRSINLSESEDQAVYSGCSYSWNAGSWSGWSSSCSATATRTRSVTCRRDPLGTTVSDSYCAATKPSTSEVTGQYNGCSYSAANWSGWSAWSSTCSSNATRTQTAQCRRSDGTIVAASECTSRGISLTQSDTGANYSSCGYSASFGAWSAWSSTCSASATRTRTATCYRSDGTAVAAAECTGRGISMSPTSETTPQYGGCGYSWNVGGWSGWSSSCSSSATRTRSVSCQRSDGSTVHDGFCSGAKPATSSVSAQYGGCSYDASYGNWSSCSSGEQTRSVTCTRSDGVQVAASYCGVTVNPSNQEARNCTPPMCVRYAQQPVTFYLKDPQQWNAGEYPLNGPDVTPIGCKGAGVANCAGASATQLNYSNQYYAHGYAMVEVVYDGKVHVLNSGFINHRKGGSATSCVNATGQFMNCATAPRSSTVSMTLGGVNYVLTTAFAANGNSVVSSLSKSSAVGTCTGTESVEQACTTFGGWSICSDKKYSGSSNYCSGYMGAPVTCP